MPLVVVQAYYLPRTISTGVQKLFDWSLVDWMRLPTPEVIAARALERTFSLPHLLSLL